MVSRWAAHSLGDGPCSVRDSDFWSGLALRWSQGEGRGDGERPIGADMAMGAAGEAEEDAADEAAAVAARFSGHDTRAAVPPLASRDGSLETGTTGGGSVIQRLEGCALARRWVMGDGRWAKG